MHLATARFQNHPAILGSGLQPVRITLGPPRFTLPYRYREYRPLAPTREIWNLPGSSFDRAYMALCAAHGPDTIRADLARLAAGQVGVVLLCFEDLRTEGPNGCHRRVFARWWTATTGQDVPELDETLPVKRSRSNTPRSRPPSLF